MACAFSACLQDAWVLAPVAGETDTELGVCVWEEITPSFSPGLPDPVWPPVR